jgi:hypothetical protein
MFLEPYKNNKKTTVFKETYSHKKRVFFVRIRLHVKRALISQQT